MLDEKTYADALTRRADMLYHIAKTILVSDDDCRDALQDQKSYRCRKVS